MAVRQIERKAKAAFDAGRKFRSGNTEVVADGDSVTVYLHGNAIIRRRGEAVSVSLAGWNTATTRSRISNIVDGAGVFSANWVPYLRTVNGQTVPMYYGAWHDVVTGEVL